MAAKTVKFTTINANKDLTSTSVNHDAAPTATPRQGGFVLRNRVNFDNVSAANKSMWIIDDATFTDDAINNFRILEVPERVYVKGLKIFAIKDATPPQLRFAGAKGSSNSSLTASDLDAMRLTFGADRNKKPTSHASYAAASHLVTLTTVNGEANDGDGAVAGEVFGALKLNVVASDALWSSNANVVLVDAFVKVDSSIGSPLEPMNTAKKIVQPTATVSGGTSLVEDPIGEYFPYGGFVNMKLGPWNTNMSSSIASGKSAAFFSSPSVATLSLHGTWEFQADCNYVPE
jgi:hypothetical protein